MGRQEKTISGRSDILCKRNNQNLFVIEVKKDSHKIKEADVRQGISYSRALVGNIAPFTVITNGKEWHIYDTITGDHLNGTQISDQSNFWKNGCKLLMDEDLRIRYEALTNFISFSENNLREFCNSQVKEEIELISGDINSRNAKYIDSLYVDRQNLGVVYQEFLVSEFPIFGIVGEAGVGKSCTMCSFALNSLNNKLVLFYNGALLNQSITDRISRDLNLFFSAKSERDLVLTKLDSLARAVNTDIVIFIDAIDEIAYGDIQNEISNLVYSIGNLNRIKLTVSCKTTLWNSFLWRNTTKNHTYNALHKFHSIDEALKNPGFHLQEFDQEESNQIIGLYRKAYDLKGDIAPPLLNKMKNGFFLKIICEVYRGQKLPPDINDIDLIRKYLSQTLKRTSIDVSVGMRFLGEFAKVILKNSKFTDWYMGREEGVEIELALSEMNLPLGSTIPQELYDRNILIRSGNDISYQVSFYYSKIRDYIICFHSFKLDKIGDDEFYESLDMFFENHIGQSAIDFYLDNADTSQKNIYRRFRKGKLLSYAVKYDNFLNEHYEKIKHHFNPYTKGKVGIIIPDDITNYDGFSLCPIESDSQKNYKTDSFDQGLNTPYHEDRIVKKGGRTIHNSSNSLLVRDQNKLVEKNCYKQLEKIIEEGKLYEYGSDIILVEKLCSILYCQYKRLKYPLEIVDIHLPRFDQIYPIDLKYLREKLYRFRAEHYFKRSTKEISLIPELVNSAFINNKKIPPLNTLGDFPPFEEMYNIVNILLQRGIDRLDKHYLPTPDVPVQEVQTKYYRKKNIRLPTRRMSEFTADGTKAYLRVFFDKVETAYKQIVESCFPTFLERMSFYMNMPHDYYIYSYESNIYNGWYGYKKADSSKCSVNFKTYKGMDLTFKEDGVGVLRAFTFDKFIHADNPVPIVPQLNTKRVNEKCGIRNVVYDLLIKDFNKIMEVHDIKIQKRVVF